MTDETRPDREAPLLTLADSFTADDPVNALAVVLMRAWATADPASTVSRHPASFVATFADMARAALSLPAPHPQGGTDALRAGVEALCERAERNLPPHGYNIRHTDLRAVLAAAEAPTARLRTDQVAQWDAPDGPDLTGRLIDTEPAAAAPAPTEDSTVGWCARCGAWDEHRDDCGLCFRCGDRAAPAPTEGES